MKICKKCGNEHTKEGTFCSRSCANVRVITQEIKEKISNSLSLYKELDLICSICNISFKRKIGSKKTKTGKYFCSRKCCYQFGNTKGQKCNKTSRKKNFKY